MVDALTRLVDSDNKQTYYCHNGKLQRGQALPIPGTVTMAIGSSINHCAVFYLSFIITPLCSNASELVSSLIFASKKKKINSSMTFSQVLYRDCSWYNPSYLQLYGAATMNNTLCLGIFCFLVAFRGLTWQYSAEVTVILLVQFVMGGVALSFGFLYKHTYLVSQNYNVLQDPPPNAFQFLVCNSNTVEPHN